MTPSLSLPRHSRAPGIFFLQRRAGQTCRSHRRIPHRVSIPRTDTGIPDETISQKEHSRCHRNDPRHGCVLSLRHRMARPAAGTDLSRRPLHRRPALSGRRRSQDRHCRRRRSKTENRRTQGCRLFDLIRIITTPAIELDICIISHLAAASQDPPVIRFKVFQHGADVILRPDRDILRSIIIGKEFKV